MLWRDSEASPRDYFSQRVNKREELKTPSVISSSTALSWRGRLCERGVDLSAVIKPWAVRAREEGDWGLSFIYPWLSAEQAGTPVSSQPRGEGQTETRV